MGICGCGMGCGVGINMGCAEAVLRCEGARTGWGLCLGMVLVAPDCGRLLSDGCSVLTDILPAFLGVAATAEGCMVAIWLGTRYVSLPAPSASSMGSMCSSFFFLRRKARRTMNSSSRKKRK